jgi:hypothetical protein
MPKGKPNALIVYNSRIRGGEKNEKQVNAGLSDPGTGIDWNVNGGCQRTHDPMEVQLFVAGRHRAL